MLGSANSKNKKRIFNKEVLMNTSCGKERRECNEGFGGIGAILVLYIILIIILGSVIAW